MTSSILAQFDAISCFFEAESSHEQCMHSNCDKTKRVIACWALHSTHNFCHCDSELAVQKMQ